MLSYWSLVISKFSKGMSTDIISYFLFDAMPFFFISRPPYYYDYYVRKNKISFYDWYWEQAHKGITIGHGLFFIYNKPYYWFVTLSPLIIIIVECICNNFVIHYVFYF